MPAAVTPARSGCGGDRLTQLMCVFGEHERRMEGTVQFTGGAGAVRPPETREITMTMTGLSLPKRVEFLTDVSRAFACLCLVLIASPVPGASGKEEQREKLEWSRLPTLPPPQGRDKQIGLAGMFAGVHKDVLIVAGGANFADGPNWEKGKKVWYDEIFILENVKADEDGGKAEAAIGGEELKGGQRYKWTRAAARLPIALGYGASISTPDGVVCIGGHDEADGRGAHYADVLRLKWNGDAKTVGIEKLPPLPEVSKMRCAGMIDRVIYVAGYTESDKGEPRRHFWAMDLSGDPAQKAPGRKLEWITLQPWDGPPLQGATCGVQDGNLYLFGGSRPAGLDENGKPKTAPSLATYRFEPGKRDAQGGVRDGKWKRVADLPRPVLVPPSPAQPAGKSQLLVFSGADGSEWHGEISKHPGFSTEVLAYHTVTDTWRKLGSIPFGVVTAPSVKWGDGILIVSGELRPCVRNPDILVARLRPVAGRVGAPAR